MDDNVDKTCVICNTQKLIEKIYRKLSECKECDFKRVLKRYYKNEDEISQKRRDKYARFDDMDNRFGKIEKKAYKF